MLKKHTRKGAFWHVFKTKLFPENQLQMEHYKLLMVPDYQPRELLHSSSIG